MDFEEPLQEGRLLRRYKRFLADVRLPGGQVVTAHTPNTGSMLGCCEPESRVWIRDCRNPQRKLRYTWELVEVGGGTLVGINTGRTNRVVREAIERGRVDELRGYPSIRPEVPYGERSRIDLLLEGRDGRRCYVEVKSVTARDETGVAFFPDAVTARGTKHLRELARAVAEGHRAVLFFCVQRTDAFGVRAAHEIDPVYAEALGDAVKAGVEVLAYFAQVTPQGITLGSRLPVLVTQEPHIASLLNGFVV